MKLSSKSMSSPGRTEKYPPPLMRFLRSNVGSKSRGRSRSSPMFVRKKNTAIETQEPSSPKVTCIGQVRVRRSKQKGSKAGRNRAPRRRRCRWVASVFFCRNFHGKLKHKSFRPCFRKWVLFFQVGFRRKTEVREKSCKLETKFQEKEDDNINSRYKQSYKEEDEEEDEEEEAQNLMYPSSTPPKNAFLLTRCRSAPYRSSSLASRFWGSPLVTTEEETGEEEEAPAPQKTVLENREHQQSQQQHQQQDHIENEEPTSESEPSCRDSAAESRTDPESEESMGLCCSSSSKEDEFEGSVNNKNNDVEIEGLKTGEVCSVRPPVILLTRCKSEPASRTSEKLLHPEAIFWRKQNV